MHCSIASCNFNLNSYTGPESITQLENELKSVVEWFRLGLEIEVPLPKLKSIEKAHWRFPEQCRLEMLQCYMQTIVDKKWLTIVQALASIGQGTLAIKIALKYGNAKTSKMWYCVTWFTAKVYSLSVGIPVPQVNKPKPMEQETTIEVYVPYTYESLALLYL